MSMAALPTKPLPYRGVLLDWTMEDAPAAEDLQHRLAPSLERWRVEGVKSAMLKLPIERAGLATIAAEHGFSFHHVPLDCNGRHVVLKKWLQPELTDKVPPFATHQVGVAGLCMDADGNMLVVKEWRDEPGGGRVPSAQWKLPGGLMDCGESFGEAAVRETFEETGVKANFKSLLCFWHRHGLTWGKSDLYYVARLEPADAASTTINLDPEEISDCRWMSISEFLATQDHPLITAVLRRCYGIDSAEDIEHLVRPEPLVELIEAGVQWPNRDPYPTYFGSTARAAVGSDES